MTTILVSAGDLSGEQAAASLVEALREQSSRPGAVGAAPLRFVGMGGDAMKAAGVEIEVDQRDLAVGGLLEVVGSLPRIRSAMRRMLDLAKRTAPDLVVLVDSGGFNLVLARRLRAVTEAPILYYVAPQVWAWRKGRLARLAERSDRIAVILPFETDFYQEHGVEVDFVGHPLLDRVAVEPSDDAPGRRVAARRELELPIDPEAPVLALFPGSRRNELTQHLPIQLDTLKRLRVEMPGLQAVIGLAPSLGEEAMQAMLAALPEEERAAIHWRVGVSETVLDAADVALVKPGTITVEAMARKCPMGVMGRANPLTARLAARIVDLPWLALPNLILGEELVPELIQDDATADRIAGALLPLFGGPARTRQIAGFDRALAALGGGGAATRTAAIVKEMLGTVEA